MCVQESLVAVWLMMDDEEQKGEAEVRLFTAIAKLVGIERAYRIAHGTDGGQRSFGGFE